jgi:lysophospholipase L1-like esterase
MLQAMDRRVSTLLTFRVELIRAYPRATGRDHPAAGKRQSPPISRASLIGLAAVGLLAACAGVPRPITVPAPTALPSVFTVPNPYALPGTRDRTDVRVGRTIVFGDSYSNAVRKGVEGWPTLLQRKGVTRSVQVYAKGGATAEGPRPRDLAAQVARFEAEHGRFGKGDLAIVYIGYNDIDGGLDLAASWAAYARLTDHLLALGATAGGRRLFVTLLHDWSRNPGAAPGLRGQVLAWNDLVRGYAAAREGVVAADLFIVFEQLFADPIAYGFANVWTPDPARTATTALFWDPRHFGERGYELIAEVYRHHLTWGWDRDDVPERVAHAEEEGL